MVTKLSGDDVYSAISINATKFNYKSDRMVGQQYHTGRWGERGFTCTTEFYKLWDAGELKEVTLTETEYEREDATTGEKRMVDSATISGYVTWAKAINIKTKSNDYETKILKSETQLKVAKIMSVKDLDISEADMAEFMRAL